jgi:hypothetical protein
MQEFSEKQIREAFAEQNKTSQVVILYFALFFNEHSNKVRLEERARGLNLPETRNSLSFPIFSFSVYSRELLDSLPIKELLSYVESNISKYSELYPRMLTLALSQYPQLFHVVNLLTEEEQRYR